MTLAQLPREEFADLKNQRKVHFQKNKKNCKKTSYGESMDSFEEIT